MNLLNKHGRQFSNGQLRGVILGDPAKPWPAGGWSGGYMDNVYVYVLPAGKGRHRVHAVCPYCDLHVSAGRLQQHLKGCRG